MAFLPATGKSFLLGGEDEAVSGELGLGELGELAGLTVANEAESPSYEVSDAEGAGLKARRLRDAAAARPSPGVQQQRRPEEDLEPEVHPAEPLRLGPRPGLPPGGTGSGHGVRGSHAEAVEPAEDGAGQEVSPAGLCVPARREALTSCLLASPPGVPLWTWSPSTPSGLTGETSACQLQQAPPPPCRRATPTVYVRPNPMGGSQVMGGEQSSGSVLVLSPGAGVSARAQRFLLLQRRRPLRHHERQRRAVLQRGGGRNHPELEHPQPQH